MEERELCALIEQEVDASIGHWSGDLADERAKELDYYNREPFGNEVEGESQVISSDVFDAVEGMLPSLLRIFTASDDVVRFEPNGPEDEEQAAQQTEVCNYVFYRQNNGFLVLYEWFKDALLQKNGVVKYYWEEKISTVPEEYKGLSEGSYRKLLQEPGTEEVEHEAYEDETAVSQKTEMLAKIPPEHPLYAQVQAAPIPQLHDVKVRVTKDLSKICIDVIPPEEFGISSQHRCVSIQDTHFCYHMTRKTISQLRELGCPEDVLAEAGSGDDNPRDLSAEALARDRFLDQRFSEPTEPDPSMKEVWVTDCFFRIDYDDDDIAELRHIVKVGNAIWQNEECDHIYFAALTPIIMPHRWVGKSAAELVMADQFTKSVIWRQMLNNLYLTNNPRKAVLSSASGVVQANLDDLMNSRAGGIMREYIQGAIRNEETPFIAGASFPMLEYIDQQKEVRTGQTRYSQGTDADSLNKTARGIQLIQQAGQQRGDLIARIFAETGVKDLMRGIAYMLAKYSTKAMTVRLRNKWVDIDPRSWKTQFDMTVNVGLGTGNKDVQIAHLGAMGTKQMELMQTGRGHLVTDENVYNLYKKTAEAMGFKHPEVFVSDPASVQKPPPSPNPDLIKIQSEAQIDQAKLQQNVQIRQFDAQTQKELAGITAQAQIFIAKLDAATKERIKQMEIAAEAQLKAAEIDSTNQIEVFKENNKVNLEQIAGNNKLQLEQVASKPKSTGESRKHVGQALEQAIEQHVSAFEGETVGTMLSVKNQVQDLITQHEQELHDQRSQLQQEVIAQRNQSQQQLIAQSIQSQQGMTQAITQLGQLLAEQMRFNREVLKTMGAPKQIDLKRDSNGQLSGADITPTIN